MVRCCPCSMDRGFCSSENIPSCLFLDSSKEEEQRESKQHDFTGEKKNKTQEDCAISCLSLLRAAARCSSSESVCKTCTAPIFEQDVKPP